MPKPGSSSPADIADISGRMSTWINDNLLILWLALGAIGSIAVLRVLASFRQQQIESHEIAREARRIRYEYKNRIRSDAKTESF